MEGAITSPSFEAFPSALHLHVLSFLPLVDRVRCALVARSWAALLTDPAFWAELRFDGHAVRDLDAETLLQLCRRAGNRLRVLDLSDSACGSLSLDDLLEAFASEGLGLTLRTLRTWQPDADYRPYAYHPVFAPEAATLRVACPVLAFAAVEPSGDFADVQGVLRDLPGPGAKRVTIERVYQKRSTPPAVMCSVVADWASVALSASSVECLVISDFDWRASFAGDAVVAERAAAKLAAALTAPEGGVKSLVIDQSEVSTTPLLGSLCRALTAASPLTLLHLPSSCVIGADGAEIAAALAPGRSRLRTLELNGADGNDLPAGGVLALLAALGANQTLTRLSITPAGLDSANAAATLAASLRSNATLQCLFVDSDRSGGSGLGPGGMRLVLGALCSGVGGPSLCALRSLAFGRVPIDLPACEALGVSLACGAALEYLNIGHCSIEPEGAAAIGAGLVAAQGAARLSSLYLHYNHVGPKGAEALGRALSEPVCPLETLHLMSAGLQDSGGTLLARGLEAAGAASRLRHLYLGKNHLGDAAAEALGRVLAAQGASGVLKKLDLHENEISCAGAARLAEGLRVNSSLDELDLCENRLGPAGAAAIAGAISGAGGVASGLTNLDLGYNAITGAGVMAMLEAGLGRNASLKLVSIAGNNLEDAGCLALTRWAVGQLGLVAGGGGSPPPSGPSSVFPPVLLPTRESQQQPVGRVWRPYLVVKAHYNWPSEEVAREIRGIVERAKAEAAAAAPGAVRGLRPARRLSIRLDD